MNGTLLNMRTRSRRRLLPSWGTENLPLVCPRFAQELVAIPAKETLIIDGAQGLKILRGRSAQHLVPELLALMDGTRTTKQMETMLPGVSPEDVRRATETLYSLGIIETVSSGSIHDVVSEGEALAFFHRYAGVTGMNRNGHEARQKLQAWRVAIFIPGEAQGPAVELKALLEETGVRCTIARQESLAHLKSELDPGTRLMVASIMFGPEDHAVHYGLDAWCAKEQIPWLRVVVDESAGYADVGPFFGHAGTPCYDCFRKLHARETSSRPESSSVAALTFWISLAASEIVYLLTRIAPCMTGRGLRRYILPEWTSLDLPYVRLPGCPRCRLLQESVSANSSHVETAVVFEDYVGLQNRSFPIGITHNERSAQLRTSEFKELPNCERHPLPREVPGFELGILDVLQAPDRVVAAQAVTKRQLAILLLTAGGIHERPGGKQPIYRWAATGGNLGSVELYVAVHNIRDLQPGFYFYQPEDHSLAHFERRQGKLEMEEFMRQAIPSCGPNLPAALILLTGAFHRVEPKYGPFGYRLLNLDAGVAQAQLHLVAEALGVSLRTASRWADDVIEDQLNLSYLQEQCTAVMQLGGNESSGPSSSQREAPRVSSDSLNVSTGVSRFYESTSRDVLETLYRESRVGKDELCFKPSEIPQGLVAVHTCEMPPLSLPAPAKGGRLLGDVITRRRSVRLYGTEPVSLEQVSTMLHCARSQDFRNWKAENDAGLELTFVIAALNVNDLRPGVYLYDGSNHGLHVLRSTYSAADNQECFTQEEFASAPVVIWSFGNLAAACARHGAFGHRQLMLRAGAAGHWLWMTGMGMGLSGCLVAGVVPGAARRLFGFDGYRKASLLALAAGFPAQSPK